MVFGNRCIQLADWDYGLWLAPYGFCWFSIGNFSSWPTFLCLSCINLEISFTTIGPGKQSSLKPCFREPKNGYIFAENQRNQEMAKRREASENKIWKTHLQFSIHKQICLTANYRISMDDQCIHIISNSNMMGLIRRLQFKKEDRVDQ